MNIASVVSHLEARGEFSGRIGIATTVEDALTAAVSMPFPNATIFAPKDVAASSWTTGGWRSEVTTTIGVIIAVSYAGDVRALLRFEQLDLIRVPIRDALINFYPAGDITPLEFVGGRLAHSEPGIILWLDEYRNVSNLGF